MKKLLLFLLLLGSIVTEARIKEVIISGGVSNANVDKSYTLAANWGVQVNQFHFEFVNNFASSVGTYEPFRIPYNYYLGATQISGANFGYEFSLMGSSSIFLMPTVGYFSTKKIYQSFSDPTTYFYDSSKRKVNVGINLRYYLSPHWALNFGTNSIERIKFSICYRLFRI